MIPKSIREYLDTRGIHFHAAQHSPRATAQETAAIAHVPGHRFAKTVALKGATGYLLAVLPADEWVDFKRLGESLGEELRLATEEELERLFPECQAGAMPPLGELYGLPVVVEAALAREPSIVCNAGTHVDLIEMPWDDFLKAGGKPRIIDYGVHA
jgi:Ala-tRNA(Pro) deacylase